MTVWQYVITVYSDVVLQYDRDVRSMTVTYYSDVTVTLYYSVMT